MRTVESKELQAMQLMALCRAEGELNAYLYSIHDEEKYRKNTPIIAEILEKIEDLK